MKLMGGYRKCGKTEELIRMAAEQDLGIITVNKGRANYIFQLAGKMGKQIRFPATIKELPIHGLSKDLKVVVDDVEDIVQEMINLPIVAMTTSLQVEKIERKFTFIDLFDGTAPEGIYRMETYIDSWDGVKVSLKETGNSHGRCLKYVTVPTHEPRQNRKGDMVNICGVTNSPMTKYVFVEENKR